MASRCLGLRRVERRPSRSCCSVTGSEVLLDKKCQSSSHLGPFCPARAQNQLMKNVKAPRKQALVT